jgi:hypothetical protein
VEHNLRTIMATRRQHQSSINVWVGIFGDQLKPGALPKRPTGAVYHHLLVNDLPVLLEHVLFHKWQYLWFMHDGTPLHFPHISKEHQTFDESGLNTEA